MPHYIMKLGGKYLDWSTVIDAPTTFGMTREELAHWYKEKFGEEGFRNDFEERMARVESCGLSTFTETVDDVLRYNRAGSGETCLSLEQIIDYYVRKADPNEPRPLGKDDDEDVWLSTPTPK